MGSQNLAGTRLVQSARELTPPSFASLANLACEQALLGREHLKELDRRLRQTAFLVSVYSVELAWGEGGWGLGVYLAGVGRFTYFVPFLLS